MRQVPRRLAYSHDVGLATPSPGNKSTFIYVKPLRIASSTTCQIVSVYLCFVEIEGLLSNSQRPFTLGLFDICF